MKILFLFTIFFSHTSFAQVEGEIANENRKCSVENFNIESTSTGSAVFAIAVNREGVVTSASLISLGTTIKGTPNLMKCKNFVLKLKFEKGTIYPKFHQGKVTVHFVLKK
jgi:hypothetical protein